MSLLDFLTGGENQNAKRALEQAKQAFENIQTPTAAELTLPELQKYVEMGIMTPAQAQVALQQGNAYNDIALDPTTTEAQMKALGQLQELSSENGMNDEMKAQLTDALNQVATQEQGQNAAILDQMAQRGIPTSLMAGAAQMANAGQQSQNANLAATQAAGQAEANAINAMMNSGNLASQIHNQQYAEAANKAAAENAMRQWNAGATNSTNLANAGYQQQANAYNAQNKQNVANANTEASNQRTQYNAQIPETIFNNQLQKAQGEAGIGQSQANQAMQAGQQQMGLYGALAGAAGNALAPAPVYIFDEGAIVPGHAEVAGDSPKNDKIPALLSPHEIVIPRSITTHPNAPEMAKNFVHHLLKSKQPLKPAHPDDVRTVLDALTNRREAHVF